MTKEEIIKELNSYLELEEGWDGYDAQVTNETIVNIIIGTINLIDKEYNMPLPVPMLSTNGDIDLYWDYPTGYMYNLYIELGVSKEDLCWSYLIQTDTQTIGYDVGKDPRKLLDKIEKFFKD